MAPAPFGYALCGEPRCGSTWLARLLASTEQLGRPFEFFRTAALAREAERDPEKVLAERVKAASTPNGAYGLKIFAHQFDLAEKCGWAERLPNLRFVHIERLDLLGQAISLVRARQTGAFESGHPTLGAARYDRRAIASALDTIGHNQARWRGFFARNGISPLRLTYESMIVDPQSAVAAVAALVGLEEVPRAQPQAVRTQVQRDDLSEEWRARFIGEAGDLSTLDQGFVRLSARIRRLRARRVP